MPQPDIEVIGPERATLEDIEALNRLFADAFTDRYHRDGMPGVRVPFLSRDIWRYAIEAAAGGALLWRDHDGQLAAFNLVHQSGAEGWMGPLAVRPGLQGSGIGHRIVRAGVAWLRRRGATVIGLETMPRTVENIGFYGQLGFLPGHLTVSLLKDLGRSSGSTAPGERLSRAAAARPALLRDCRALTEALAPGVDYTREIVLTEDLRLGDTTVCAGEARVSAFALWQTAALAQARPADELRVLKLVAADLASFRAVVGATERIAVESGGIARISIRCQTVFSDGYAALLADGYRVHWTDLRMTLQGAGERTVPPGIVMSNWEI